ncbi:MAG: hypothetical protein KF767_16990 [Bdellovibrionaceae bacterium]|nr:hypothetical protein [Pseudobdellovibrionaceae bacterium]
MAESTLAELPAVAKSIYLECKKCEAERYHKVLAHTTATSAKVECEVCGSKKTYKLPSAKKAAAKKPGTGKPRVARASKAEEHKNEFEKLMGGNGEAQKYNMKLKFENNAKIDHPKFGMGVVRSSLSDKIEVVFQDEVRNLVHNRG